MARPRSHPSSHSGRSFVERFGPTILSGGITTIPTALYLYQGVLGLTPQEVWFVGYILAHKWDQDLPYPSLVQMAENTAMSRRNLLRIKDSLVTKNLLVLVRRYSPAGRQEANAYDFSPLFARLEECIYAWGPRAEYRPNAPIDADQGVPSDSPGTVTDVAPLGVTAPSQTTETAPSQTTETTRAPTTVISPSHEIEPVHKETKDREPPPVDAASLAGAQALFLQNPEELIAEASVPLDIPEAPTNGKHSEDGQHAVSYTEYHTRQQNTDRNGTTYSRPAATHPTTERQPPVRRSANGHPPPRQPAPGSGPHSSPQASQPISAVPPAPGAELIRLWQTALIQLRLCLPAEVYTQTLRYVELREFDAAQGWALLSVPNRQIQARLQQPPLAAALRAILRVTWGQAIQVAVIVQSLEETSSLTKILEQQALDGRLADLVADHQGSPPPTDQAAEAGTPDEMITPLAAAIHANALP